MGNNSLIIIIICSPNIQPCVVVTVSQFLPNILPVPGQRLSAVQLKEYRIRKQNAKYSLQQKSTKSK